jgi:choline dehydrogenase-like flavoprotein
MMPIERYDVVIIGTGAGGGTMAYALADSAARILILERGDFVPQENENWSPEAVWKQLRYQTRERWIDERGSEFRPYTHYNVGGNTKFWGSVLYRLRREDFHPLEHMEGVSPGWPIDYGTLEPYYERAERLYHVHGEPGTDPTEPDRGPFPHAPVPQSAGMASIVEQLREQGLHPSPLPLGLRDGCVLCNTCNSFACKVHAKSEADVCCVRPAIEHPNVTLWTNAYAARLLTNGAGMYQREHEVKGAEHRQRFGLSGLP